MLINNSFSIVDKKVSNSAEFIFSALQVDGSLCGHGIDESLWGGELLSPNIGLALIPLAKVSKSSWSWAQS